MGAAHHGLPLINALCTCCDLPSLGPSKEELPDKLKPRDRMITLYAG